MRVSALGNLLALLSVGWLGVIRADFFNDYFDDKVFGANPGPCPNEGDCFLILETDELPVYIRDIEFCLIKSFFITICDELKDWVRGGRVDLWEMQCQNIGVTDISLNEVSENANTVVNRIAAKNVQQKCKGKAKFTNVELTSGRLTIFIDMHTDWTTNPDASGININFDVALTANGGFDNNLVDSADVRNCDFDLELGLRVQNINYQRFEVRFIFSFNLSSLRDLVTNLLLRILEGLFGSALCGVIEQGGTLSNGQPGVLNVVLGRLNERYDKLIEPTSIDVAGTDAQFVANPAAFGADPEKVKTALVLDDSNSLEFISVTLNDFLGNPKVTPLRINQAIALLTEPDGNLFFDVTARDLTIEFPLSFADANAKLEKVTIVGLNTIDFFEFLKNDYSGGGNGLDYTLKHKFEMETFQFLFTIQLGLSRGEWVTASSCGVNPGFLPDCVSDQEVFSFDFGLKVSDITFEAATLTAFDIDQIGGIQIGQILDQELTDFVGAAEAILSCTAPSIFAFIFSDLQMRVGSISDPFVENFSGQGVDQLIENSVELTDVLLRNLLANDLPAMMQGPVREFVNDFLKKNVSDVDSLENCPPYQQVVSPQPYIELNKAPVNGIFPIINDVLGNFDANSDVDLNDFVQSVMKYYSVNADEFPLFSTGTVGDWDTKANRIPLARLNAFKDANAFMSTDAFTIRNLDTISLFNALDRAAFPFGLTSDIQFGGAGNDELKIGLKFDVHQSVPSRIDTFEFTVALQNFHIVTIINEILLNLDSLNRLRIEDLAHVPCVLSVLDGITADSAPSSLSADAFDFNLVFFSPQSGSSLRGALETLLSEFQNPVNPERFTRVANYFMDIGFQTGLDSLKDLNYTGQPEGCQDIESDFSKIFNIFLGFGIPNLNVFADECLVDITPPAAIADYEKAQLGYTNSVDELEGDLLVLRDNFFIKILKDSLNVGNEPGEDPSLLENLLFTFANTSGNAIVDLFILEDDNKTVTFILPLNEDNIVLETLGFKPLKVIDGNGFKAEAKSLRIRGINNFLERLNFFDPLSDFLLKFDLGFTEADPLKLEVIIGLEANATIVDEAPVGSPAIVDEIVASIELNGVQSTFEILTVIRADLVKKLSVAHFISVNETQSFSLTDFATNCILANVVDGGLNMRTFQININDIGEPEITSQSNDILSPGVQELVEEVGKVFIGFYADAIPNICENCIKKFINDNMKAQLEKAREPGACPADPNFVELSKENEVFRFSDSALVEQMQNFLVDKMYSDNFELWNSFMEGFTAEKFFDKKEFDSGIAQLTYKNTDYGGIQLKMKDVQLTGYGTFDHVQFLEPVSRNKVDFDEAVDPFTVTLSFHYDGPASHSGDFTLIGYDFFTQAPVVTNQVTMDITLSDVTFAIVMVLKLNLNTLMKIQFDQVDTLDELPCLLTPVQELDVVDFNFTNGGLKASADCFGVCDSELIAAANGQIVDDNPELNDALNTFISFSVRYIESSPAQRLINVALDTSEDTCASLLSGLDDFLQPGPEDVDVFSFMLYIFLGVAGLALCALAYQYPRHKKRTAMIMRRFKNDHEKEFAVDKEMAILQNELRSLAGSPIIPMPVKVIVPLVCSVNIIGLCFAILKQGALTILMKLTIIGMELNTIDLVPFTVISTVNDMWNGGAWPLAILIVGASCAWPIIKNVILLFLWMTPTTIVPVAKRGKYFELLDIAGKWSFLDVFVVVVTLAALFAYVELSQQEDLQFLDSRALTLELTVRPELGIVILATVAATSLLVNHVMSYYNRKSTEHYRIEFDKIAGTTKMPKLASAKRPITDYKFPTRAVSPRKMNMLMIAHVVSFVCLIAGLLMPVITFEIRGIVGLALGAIDQKAVLKQYSIFSLGTIISEAPADSTWENFVLVYFQFMYFLVSIIGPVAQFIAVGFILSKKFTLGNLTVMVEATMIISFWSALDVVYVGIVATLLEVTKVTEFIVDFVTSDICTNVKGAIEVFVPDEKDDSCLSVIGYLEIGAAPLAIGLIGQLMTLTVVVVLSFRIIQDRYYYAYVRSGLRPRDSKPPKLGYIRDKVIKLVTVPQKRRAVREPSKEDHDVFASNDPDAMGFEAVNPRFAGAPSRIASPSGEGEFVAVPESVAGTNLFDLMDGPHNAGRASRHSPMRSNAPPSTVMSSKRTPVAFDDEDIEV